MTTLDALPFCFFAKGSVTSLTAENSAHINQLRNRRDAQNGPRCPLAVGALAAHSRLETSLRRRMTLVDRDDVLVPGRMPDVVLFDLAVHVLRGRGKPSAKRRRQFARAGSCVVAMPGLVDLPVNKVKSSQGSITVHRKQGASTAQRRML